MIVTESQARRRQFLDHRREESRRRYDELHAATYDEQWASCAPTHVSFVERLIHATPAGGVLLDAACGTGKYWPQLLGAGCRLVGVDQSAGMLAGVSAKHPDVPTRRLALQELASTPDLAGRFDGLLCVDAMENVGPEDWPLVLAGFRTVLRPGGIGYLTVELPDEAETSDPTDAPLVAGELLAGGGYHYYPPPAAVRDWLAAAGFVLLADGHGDEYYHVLVRSDRASLPG
jgi:cyclopropane fatty-acyl-phospholipid synthase-like methyltransferase